MGKKIGDERVVLNKKKDDYIKELEREIKILSLNKEEYYNPDDEKLNIILKKQEDFLLQHYYDRDNLVNENKRLNQELARLTRTIELNHLFINYLGNSYWWKLIYPFRSLYRRIINKPPKYNFVVDVLNNKDKLNKIEEKVSVLIFTYNAGEEFTIQLDNLTKQKLIEEMEIIVIDRGSYDNTLKYAKKYDAKIINIEDNELTDSQIYEKILPTIEGEYVVIIDQNKVVDSKFWIYQSLIPIIDDMAVSTVFFDTDINYIKRTTYYQDLKSRINVIAGEQVLFFPQNRNMIQYFSVGILDKSCILVKRKVSNMFLI